MLATAFCYIDTILHSHINGQTHLTDQRHIISITDTNPHFITQYVSIYAQVYAPAYIINAQWHSDTIRLLIFQIT